MAGPLGKCRVETSVEAASRPAFETAVIEAIIGGRPTKIVKAWRRPEASRRPAFANEVITA